MTQTAPFQPRFSRPSRLARLQRLRRSHYGQVPPALPRPQLLLPIVALALAAGISATAQYVASPASGPITVDGKLDEPAWPNAEAFRGFHLLSSLTKSDPTAATSFRVLAGVDAVFIGVRCDEPSMDKLKAEPCERDKNVFAQDCVEMFIDPAGTGNTYYQLVVSANNDQWDSGFIERGNTSMDDYSSIWDSAVHQGADFWSLEVRLPLSAFYNTRADAFTDTWKLNVARERKPVYELASWSPLKRGFHEPESWRSISGMPIKAAADDLAVTGVQTEIRGKEGAGCRGSAVIRTFAGDTAVGACALSVLVDGEPIGATTQINIPAGDAEILVEDLSFPREGRLSLQLAFGRPDGTPRLGVIRSVIVKYQPFVFTLDEPFYAACVFDGQSIPEIKGTLQANLPPDVLRDSDVTLAFTGPGLETPATRVVQFEGDTAVFAFDAEALQTGEATLTANAVHDGASLAEGTQVIRKLPPNTGGSTVYIDRNLNLVANGRPLFYRGWYGGGTWMVSYVHQKRWPTPQDAFPATDMGKSVGVEAERIDKDDVPNTQRDVRPSQKVLDTIRQRAANGRRDPDLWWYYLSDEPECRSVSPVYLKHCYDLIKDVDPYHPVVIISRAPERYTECADILSPHPYLNPMVIDGKRVMASPTGIRRQVRTVLNAGKGKILPWLTPQAFSYGFQVMEADYPTFAEARCMVWTAVANGCKGFHPFIYHGALDRPDLLHGYRMFYESLARLEPILIGPSKPGPVTVDAPGDGVDAMIKAEGDTLLVVAVNLLDEPVDATLTSAALEGIAKLDRFREPGVVPVAGKAVKLSFEPYGVALLTHPPLDDDLDTVEIVRERIARDNASRVREGNILFGRGREIEYSSSSTYVGMKGLQVTLTDGMRDNVGWRHISGPDPAWVEMAFPSFVPQIRTLKVFGNRLQGMEVEYWKGAEWHLLGTAPDDVAHEAGFTPEEPLHTVKLRFTLPNSQRAHVDGGELYEIEIYE